jgi:hypothetical protein
MGTDHVVRIVRADPWRMSVLRAVRALDLPDWAVGAGFVRNAVWDRLHRFAAATPPEAGFARPRTSEDRRATTRAPGDVDVLYFDPGDCARARETAIEARLAAAMPGVPWSVRNQARMHRRNGDAPYRDTEDALRYWLETATCVAVRLEPDDTLTVIAPYGLDDLLGLRSGPTPRGRARHEIYRARMRAKNWPARWPRVRVAGL